MRKHFFQFISSTFIMAVLLAACTDKLDRMPSNTNLADNVYSSVEGYKSVLAKVYGAFALTGSNGSGSSDLEGIDAGTSDFLRMYWNAQELSTDEAICAWNDPGIPDFHNMNWTANNVILMGLYYRCQYQITMANEFIRESTDDKISSRGISGADADAIREFRAEARFLRAFQYWVLMDLFAQPSFVTENDPIGAFTPPQKSRQDLFAFIESELKDIEEKLVLPRQNEYARVDRAAAWALLARLYLNANVYIGQDRYTDAITYSKKVIDAGYTLHSKYANLFLADNNINNPEVILPIAYDGIRGETFAGTTFLINSSINADLNPATSGVPGGGWGGNRSTKNLPLLFEDYSGNADKRAIFAGSKLEIDAVSQFTDGLAVLKFKNITSTGATAPSNNGTYCSTDFPLFRLAEQYLIYAEAVLRGGAGGDLNTALSYINTLRERAYEGTSGNITSAQLTLDFILDERARELYWEGFRRTDLIRFNKFTEGSYLWPWKGGVKSGTGVDAKYKLFPIPSADIIANPNLTQNPGY